MQSILIVDDEKNTRDGLCQALSEDYDVFAAANADEAIKMLDAEHFDAVITDLRMSGKSGLSVIDKTMSMPQKPVCIMLTAYGNVETAVEAMKRGASDFLSKPIDIEKLEISLKTNLQKRENILKNAEKIAANAAKSVLKTKPSEKTSNVGHSLGGAIIAESAKMKEVLKTAKKVAESKATVMLSGETGTGKEIVARLIHETSPRTKEPFVAIHCAAIPANLLESEIFGYEKGAFTGAAARRMGRFEAANGGTLFLDEIGEIDAPTQVKLLRFLETKSFERLGGNQIIKVDVRLICATNKNLKEMVERGEFREDLYYRLNVVEIKIPPLREHREDILPLLDFYIKYYAEENALPEPSFAPETLEILKNFQWKGNIRELRNFCENLAVMNAGSTIFKKNLPAKFFEKDSVELKKNTPNLQSKPETNAQNLADSPSPFSLSKKDNEMLLIKKALEASGGCKTKAAQILGISRRTLHRKLSAEGAENAE